MTDAHLEEMSTRGPDVVLLDGQAAEAEYLQLTPRILEACPRTKCMVIGRSVDLAVMARAVAAGVAAYLPAHITCDEFVQAVTDVAAGRPMSADGHFANTARLMARPGMARDGGNGAVDAPATVKECAERCLQLGLTTAETSAYLRIPEDQVKAIESKRVVAEVRPSWGLARPSLVAAAVALVLASFGLSWALSGGGGADGRCALDGTVSLDGRPLPNAIISFRPIEPHPFTAGANVIDGRFAIPQRSGLTPGRYVVRINASVRDPSLPPPPAGERDLRPGVEVLPERYNAATELAVEVRRSAENRFVFDLKSR